ncbi:MAG: GreA/GreB family elongation factor [Ferruginibacter sp.]
MRPLNKQLILRKDDYNLLVSYLKGGQNKSMYDRQNAEELQTELKKAKLVEEADFPPDVVRLNSKVKIRAEGKRDILKLMLVMPSKADIKQGKISIMAPIGTALLGFRQGQVVNWQVPSGKKKFTIIEVANQHD